MQVLHQLQVKIKTGRQERCLLQNQAEITSTACGLHTETWGESFKGCWSEKLQDSLQRLWPKTTLTLLADQREIADGLVKDLSSFLNPASFSSAGVKKSLLSSPSPNQGPEIPTAAEQLPQGKAKFLLTPYHHTWIRCHQLVIKVDFTIIT